MKRLMALFLTLLFIALCASAEEAEFSTFDFINTAIKYCIFMSDMV